MRRHEFADSGIIKHCRFLVFCQDDIDEFSWPASVQGKARLAVNGHSPSQKRNVAMDADRPPFGRYCDVPPPRYST